MELGEKLRQARLEAGLSQRQLCEGVITRNMLSLIEHGTAKPSMDTLRQLSARLEKPMSFFLEENTAVSPNQAAVEQARRLYDAGDFDAAARTLGSCHVPDPVYARELELLRTLILLGQAEQAIETGRFPYALELLNKADADIPYCSGELNRRRLLLLGRLPDQQVADRLPSLDAELLLRAREALDAGNRKRAAQLLDAAEDHAAPHWNLLRGRLLIVENHFRKAARHLLLAEDAYPKEAIPLLETCYRELGDFKRAYEYACKRR